MLLTMKKILVLFIHYATCAVPPPKGIGRRTPTDNLILCHTSVCKENANKLLDSIDDTIDPCDNFYQYTCGKWLRNHSIGPNEIDVSEFRELEKQVTKVVIALLEDRESDRGPWEAKLKRLYNQCMDEAQREALRSGPLLDFLEYSLGGWPILKPDWDPSKFDALDALLRSFLAGVEPFFVLEQRTDPTSTTLHEIMIKEPDTFARFEIMQDDLLRDVFSKSYRTYMFEVHALLLRDSNATAPVETFLNNLTQIFDTEQLISWARQPMAKRDDRNYTERYSLLQLDMNNSSFNSLLLRNLSNYIRACVAAASVTEGLHDNTTVVISNILLLKKLDVMFAQFEQEGQEGRKRMANYIGWHAVKTYVDKLSKDYLDVIWAFHAKVYEMPANSSWPLSLYCLANIRSAMPLALGAMYIKRNISAELRKKATVIVKNVQAGFKELLDAATDIWLDDLTYEAAVKKLFSLKVAVGYQQALLNNTLLAAYYADITLEENFLKSMLNVAKSAKFRNLRRLAMPLQKDEPSSALVADITTANAHHEPYFNRLVIHAAMLHPAFFNPDGPHYANYAGLGAQTGHEITHGFDGTGSRYDENGIWRNWWSDYDTVTAFDKRLKSMRLQYDDYVTEFGNVSGILTDRENVAENGGYRAAYKAYIRYLQQPTSRELVPLQLSHYSPQQLFFVSAGMNMCRKNRPHWGRVLFLTDRHTPAEWRVNGVVSNMVEFAQVFNCSANATMNPSIKRIVW